MKASTWSDICGTRKERMAQQSLSSRATSSVREYVLHYKGFRNYCKSKGIVLTLPCDSFLISEYLSYLQDAKNSYAVLSLAFSALKWVHDVIPHGPLGNPVIPAFLAILLSLASVYSVDSSRKKSLSLRI